MAEENNKNKQQLEEIKELKAKHPNAEILVHPESSEAVCDIADYAGSTSGIISYAAKSDKKEFIIGTEIGVKYELEKQNPDKSFFFPATPPVCKDMKLITLEKILHVLKTGENEASVDEAQAKAAKETLTKMLELAK